MTLLVICEILAGGTGTRMGGAIPKQFIKIGGLPIIVRTVNAFIKSGKIDCYVICTPADYTDRTEKTLKEYGCFSDNMHIVPGGECRNGSVYNGCKYIKSSLSISNDDMIVTHDAVRPFINDRIINGNIKLARLHGAATTAIACIDTVLSSKDGAFACEVPDRSELFRVQTPQTFRFSLLWDILSSAGEEELLNYSDTAGLVLSRGIKPALVIGEDENIKITTPFDIKVAQKICLTSIIFNQP